MSSVYQDYGATHVIDGVYNDEQSIAHTKLESSPWIQIHLTQNESIKGAKIWNRCDYVQGETKL